MKTKIRARKKTVIRWIEDKFGSLRMLAETAGVDTSEPAVRKLLNEVVRSREPVILGIRWRSVVIEVHIEHHTSTSLVSETVNAAIKLATSNGVAIPDMTAATAGGGIDDE